MYRHGYQAMRIDAILSDTGLTKGAFYHHFPSKRALGETVIDEVLAGMIEEMWVRSLADYVDPIIGIKAVLQMVPSVLGPQVAQLGCPLNNLAQEMSPIDEVFRGKLNRIFHVWIESISDALKRGQKNGSILPAIDTHGAAIFIVAAYEGAISMTKSEQSDDMMMICAGQIELYLESLRP